MSNIAPHGLLYYSQIHFPGGEIPTFVFPIFGPVPEILDL